MDEDTWEKLKDEWIEAVGAFDTFAIRWRTQAGRGGLMLLLLGKGEPLAFVKLGDGSGEGIMQEYEALQIMRSFRPRTFTVPEPLRTGVVGDWVYTVVSALPPQIHRPPRKPPIRLILFEVASAMEAIERPYDALAGWQPMHGDFTPWNLRSLSCGSLVLYDWEDVGWGPQGADEVLFAATQGALHGRRLHPHPEKEAVEFWLHQSRQRSATNERDRRLTRKLERALQQMGGRVGLSEPPHTADSALTRGGTPDAPRSMNE